MRASDAKTEIKPARTRNEARGRKLGSFFLHFIAISPTRLGQVSGLILSDCAHCDPPNQRSCQFQDNLKRDERPALAHQPIPHSLPEPTADERTMGFLAHLLQIFTGFLGPLAILLVRQNSPFVKFHAWQSLIWQLCFTALSLGGLSLAFFSVFAAAFHDLSRPHSPNSVPAFFLLFPLLWLFAICGWIVNVILGVVYGLKAQRGEWAAYPIIGKWCFPK